MAVLISATKQLKKPFLKKELQKNISFEIYFKDDMIEKYAIIRFGSKKEIVERKK
ncbi:hypothetical protein P7M26_24480 [Vibrio parahaemolyticus]|nr:hypothetical protein [Vibrio parahaemolyticus]